MAHNTEIATSPRNPRRIGAVAATIAVVGLSLAGGLASASQADLYPGPGGGSGVSTHSCAHVTTADVYPAPGGASGVSTLPCAHAGA